MSKEICTVCGREIDSRGMSGHMRTHKGKSKKDDTDGGVISYPSNEQVVEKMDTVVVLDESPRKLPRKPPSKSVKKTVASKPASSSSSSPPSKPDARGQRKSEQEHITDLESAGHPKDSGAEEWKGFFRE